MTIRVVAITDVSLLGDDPRAAFARAVEGCPAGSVMIQIRAKHLDGGPLLALARAAAETGFPMAINDRVDVALAARIPNVVAVHLPENGLSITDVRSLGIQSLEATLGMGGRALTIGVSRHSIDGVAEAVEQGADVVQLGPIWDTPTKGPALGTGSLATARHHIELSGRACRLVAVGGIDSPARAREAVLGGAHAVALIRAAWTGGSLLPYVTAVDDALAFRDLRADR
ncbi:MAG TPA: thiamine phosphate synthase [Kofleriaceae bacterium]|jgi:thiamine-phosphate pyrophosphorylase